MIREHDHMFTLSMILVVCANLIYHWGQKSVPVSVPLLLSLAQTFATALVLTLLLIVITAGDTLFRSPIYWLNPQSVSVGVAIVGIELGFLLAYRAGWPLNIAALFASTALSIILVFTGFALFREPWSIAKSAGLILCLTGLWLLSRR